MILEQCNLDSPELRAEVLSAQAILRSRDITPPDPALQEKKAKKWTFRDFRRKWIQEQVALLQNSEATVRAGAAKQLGFEAYLHNDDPPLKGELHAARDALLSTLANDPDAAVRANAAWGLGQPEPATPEVLTALLSTLREDPDATVRSTAAWSLGQPGVASSEVLTALRSAFRDDPDAAVRASAAESLVQGGLVAHEMLTALSEGLQVSRHWYVREGAAVLLGKFDQGDESTIQTLLNGLRDSDGYVRLACAEALVQIGQRFPTQAATIESKLVQAIADPAFESVDTTEMPDDNFVTRRPAYDYGYDALWLLVDNRRTGEE
jgi:HEAT repeat protein